MTQILVKHASLPEQLQETLRGYNPRTDLGKLVREACAYLPPQIAKELLDSVQRSVVVESSLALTVIRNRASRFLASPKELLEFWGVVSKKVVTDTGVGFIVDAFQNSVEVENMKYHGLGTGSTAEAASQSALVTELTTEYTGNVRATGTTTEGATGNIYRTVGTNTLDSGTPALREHGVFSANAAGVMLDRSLFAAINLDGTAGDGLQSTYELTFSSGG
jgi:hypothetical protein